MQTACLQSQPVLFPTARALAAGEFHGQHMPSAVPTEAERSRDRVASADAVVPDPFVTRIEDDAGIRFLQPARPEAPQFLVQLRVQFADRTRAKLMAA